MTPYYSDDLVTIWHGDCRELMPALAANVADLVLADPPYLEGDMSDTLDEMLRIGRKVVVTPGKQESFNWIRRRAPFWEYAWKCSGTSSLGGSACLHILFEPILAYHAPVRPLGSDLLDFPLVMDPTAKGHPWPKPLRLFTNLVAHFTLPNALVLDPFMGTGTTLKAARELGRRAIGIEIEERYCEIAARRCSQEVLGLLA